MAAARAALVAELQAEFFAEDLVPPDRSTRWSDADLRRFFETGGEWRPRLLPPPLGRKARVALLHGTASNAKIVRVQLGRLTARLERDGVCDPIVIVQGSLPCGDDNKMVDLMRTFFPGEPLFQYAVPSLDADERRTYDNVLTATAKIEAELRAAAPIDAIIGFSQGANMATILAARAHARADGALDPPPRCVALLLPSRPGWPKQCDGAFGSDAAVRRVPIPALIVDGKTDAMQARAPPRPVAAEDES